MPNETELHNGLPGPRGGSPERVPGSVRRTTSVDLLRPADPTDPVVVRGRGRDLLTEADGAAVLASGLTQLTVIGGRVQAITTHPATLESRALAGRRALVGWRTGVWRQLRGEYDAGSVLHLLLDEVPGMMVIGGFTGADQPRPPGAEPRRRIDVCAGWAAESRTVRILETTGAPPPPVTPPAPDLATGDPGGWHTLPGLPERAMSRRRRIDVLPADGVWHVDAMFRDVFVAPDGSERVLHEYGVQGEVAAESGRLLTLRTEPRVLPHTECPRAAGSARMLLGMPIGTFRERVSADLYGPASCTHLNDLLRSLSDVPALAAAAAGPA